MWRIWLADLILVIHFLIVLFNVGGLLAIWLGAALGWGWVRNFWFRVIHLGLMGFIAVQAAIGALCPLTVWEDQLRGGEPGNGFLQRWIAQLLFYDLPGWFFTVAYIAFAGLVLLTFFLIPPRRRTASAP